MAFVAGYILVGTPKTPRPGTTKAFFFVDAATSQVRRILLIDQQGNRNRLDLLNVRIL
jgi:outer membrane lipoprotein carrier protein